MDTPNLQAAFILMLSQKHGCSRKTIVQQRVNNFSCLILDVVDVHVEIDQNSLSPPLFPFQCHHEVRSCDGFTRSHD